MDVSMGSIQLPVSTMNIFNNVAILTLVPLFETYLYPALKARGKELSMLTKIGLGFSIALAAMVAAAIVEAVRVKNTPAPGNYFDEAARNNISPCRSIDNYNPYQYQKWYADPSSETEPSNCHSTCSTIVNNLLSLDCITCDDIPQMSRVSILWQVPQFVLIGLSEIFASITSLEFFYSQAPSNMRSVSQACNLFTNALGSWLTIPLTLLVNADPNNEWIPKTNIDDGHLDYYFYLLAALMLAALGVFYRISQGFQYADPAVLEALAAEGQLNSSSSSSSNADSHSGNVNKGLESGESSSLSPLLSDNNDK